MEYWEPLGFGGWDLVPESLLERRKGYIHSRNMGIIVILRKNRFTVRL